jgi:outer membrane protein assembly factor BamB
MNSQSRFLLACAGFGIIGLATATDWPQWRGPQRTGVSQETGLLAEWPKEGPKLLWQLSDVGNGYATPAVAGTRIYLLSNRGMENESVQALSVQDGKPVWSTRLGNVGSPNQSPPYPMARSTPTVDGDRLYALGSDGDIACLETATGKLIWQKNLQRDFGGKPGKWAYAESPLIDGETLVLTPGGAEATLVALNKKTGAVIWKSAVPGGDAAAYSSAIVAEPVGRKQYIQFLDKGVVGVDAKTGQFLWRYEKTSTGPANIPTPIEHDGYVYSANAQALWRRPYPVARKRRRSGCRGGLLRAGRAQHTWGPGAARRIPIRNKPERHGLRRISDRENKMAGARCWPRRGPVRRRPSLRPRRER